MDTLKSIAKAIVAGLGALLTALTFAHQFDSFLPGPVHTIVGIVIAVLTPLLTWLVPNKTKTPEPPAAPAA